MKAKLALFFLAVAAVAPAADTAPLSGKWQIHNVISEHESDENCTFVQNGNDLTGTCTSNRGTGSISGKVDDRKVTWTYKSNTGANGPVTLQYTGTLNSATAMSGSVTVKEYGVEGEFTATQPR